MKIPQHIALSFLLAQFGAQQQYGWRGTALVVAAGCLPDVDALSALAGWHAHRTWRGTAGHGLPVTLAAPPLLALLGCEMLGLGPLEPLWLWLQLSLLAHLAADVCWGRWPVRLLWPASSRKWGGDPAARDHAAPVLILYAAAAAALFSARWAPAAAAASVGALVLYTAWRLSRPHPAAARRPEPGAILWEGCGFFAWLTLLARNRFAVHPSRWPVTARVTFASLVNTLLAILTTLCYARRVRRAPPPRAPLFILGHWRTGTTLLHELLALDERHAAPTTYQCLAPGHFLLTERWLPRLLWFLVPSIRPMDNMAAGWDRPQEDEFALCVLGRPSPYAAIAFPNRRPPRPAPMGLEGLSARALAAWKRTFLRLLRQLALSHAGKRLVLKSPAHTCRIETLLEMFPDARFVHIVRDPHVVFVSTVNLWRSLYEGHGLQRPTFEGLEEYVFGTFTQLYARLEATRGLVTAARFYELRYEDLVRDPVGQLRALYAYLELGGFDAALPRVQKYLAGVADYRTNRYDQPPELRAEIERRCGEVIRRYGYDAPSP
jgi:hypothetical protein